MISRNIFISKIINLNFSQYRLIRKSVNKVQSTQNPFKLNYDENSSIDVTTCAENKLDEDSIEESQNKSITLPSGQLIPNVDPASVPAFNIAAYLKTSESLKQLINLGVDLSKIEKRKGLGQFILKLDIEKNIKPHIQFLHDVGVPSGSLGEILTKNPLIFKVDKEDLKIRINYLESKNFIPEQISRICTINPFWLMFSTKRIDRRLGYFQVNFQLDGNGVRNLATKQPRLITYNMDSIAKNTFCMKEEMGFNANELKVLLLQKPRLWMMNNDDLIERFDYVHNKMQISHKEIVNSPEILTSREFRIRQRHEYLKLLGLDQYDPSKDLYVSLKKLVEGNDRDFVLSVAKTDIKSYDKFLRTL